MNILMTGQSGLIGSAIYKKLVQDGNSVLSIGRGKSDYKINISYFKPIDKVMSCDIFIHCAGITDEEILEDKSKVIQRGTKETVALLDWVSSLKPDKIVYISTAHVYGDLNRKIDEETPTTPISLYAILHLFCEQYLKMISKRYLILRPLAGFGEVGPNFKRWGLIPFAFPKSLATENRIVIKTHGKQYRNFVSTDTIGNIVRREIQTDESKVVNPVGPHNMSVIDYAKFCVDTLRPISDQEYEIIVQKDAEYSNYFNYSSIYKYEHESTQRLNDHIVNIYKKFK